MEDVDSILARLLLSSVVSDANPSLASVIAACDRVRFATLPSAFVGGSLFRCAPNLTLNSVLWKVRLDGEVGLLAAVLAAADSGGDGTNEVAGRAMASAMPNALPLVCWMLFRGTNHLEFCLPPSALGYSPVQQEGSNLAQLALW